MKVSVLIIVRVILLPYRPTSKTKKNLPEVSNFLYKLSAVTIIFSMKNTSYNSAFRCFSRVFRNFLKSPFHVPHHTSKKYTRLLSIRIPEFSVNFIDIRRVAFRKFNRSKKKKPIHLKPKL